MNEQEALSKMIAPGTPRPGKYRTGVIQIHITRACDKSCYGCTQGSNLKGKLTFMPPAMFEQAVLSLKGYFGVVGVFGGNPALHPQFGELCDILKKYIPFNQRGLWCNNPLGKGLLMRETFDPSVSNLNVHLDCRAYDEFKRDWPECSPVGLTQDSRHSPPWVAMKDVLTKVCSDCNGLGDDNIKHEFNECKTCSGKGKVYDESKAWELISDCDINKHWSAMIGMFRGELRAWFCEIAGAQSILHQDEPDYPDTGLDPTYEYEHHTAPGDRIETTIGKWWQLPMKMLAHQVRKHCHECGIPLRGYGELAQAKNGTEHVSTTHQAVFKPKDSTRRVELVMREDQLSEGRITNITRYLQNANK